MHTRDRTWSLPLAAAGLVALTMSAGMAVAASTGADPRDAMGRSLKAVLSALGWLLAQTLIPTGASPWLLLVFGGVLVLATVGVGLLVGNALPFESAAPPAPAPRRVETTLRLGGPSPDVYRGPKDQEFERGRTAGGAVKADELDDVLDTMVSTELGEPRVLRAMPNVLRLRLHACRGCAGEADVCAFECGFLEAAFARLHKRSVVVHEVRCRGRGADACDFEVWT